jgi:hypothetical protein
VYAVAQTPETGTVVRRHFSSDFVRHHPQATYAVRLAGEDPEVLRRVEVRFNGRLLDTGGEAARRRVTLTPPFPSADRNELAFRHLYDVPASLTGTTPYRIGRTGRHSPVDLDVRSAGTAPGRVVSVRVNGLELVGSRGWGYWVAALAPPDGRVLGVRGFDAHETVEASERLAAFIEGWPERTIVVAAAMEVPGSQLTGRVVTALRSIGGRGDLPGAPGLSHVLIGVRGANPGEALEEWGAGAVRAVVGKDRPIGVTLERFELL